MLYYQKTETYDRMPSPLIARSWLFCPIVSVEQPTESVNPI